MSMSPTTTISDAQLLITTSATGPESTVPKFFACEASGAIATESTVHVSTPDTNMIHRACFASQCMRPPSFWVGLLADSSPKRYRPGYLVASSCPQPVG